MNTQHAPTTLRATPITARFKGKRIAAIAAASALTFAIPAKAIDFRLVEDSSNRFALDVRWGASRFQPSFWTQWNIEDLFAGYVYDDADNVFASSIRSLSYGRSGPSPTYVGFTISFAGGIHNDRSFEVGDIIGFSGSEVLPLNKGEIGARFVYGTPLRVVPDHGSTALLLGGWALRFTPRAAECLAPLLIGNCF